MNEPDRKELIIYRIKRANETLNEVILHVNNGLWNTAVNRMYYACYYAVSALLVKHEIFTKSHSGVRQMFGMHFIKTGIIPLRLGLFFSDIFDKRQTGDYDDFIDFKKEDVMELLPVARELIQLISDMTNE